MRIEKPREIAARVLSQHAAGQDFTENLLGAALADSKVSAADRRLCQELVYGVIRWQATLDWLIDRRTGGRTQKRGLQILLRLGLYQIFWLERVPDHALVHETVEQAKERGFGPQAGFVNALLRGCLREEAALREELARLRASDPATGYSHPAWLVKKWGDRWGGEPTRRLLEWDNTPPPTFARVNTLKTDAGKLVERWREEGVDYEFRNYDWTGENLVFELRGHPSLETLGSFRDGWFYIQDPSTLLAVQMLKPRRGDFILDACAAPGGKTTFIAQLMDNQGQVFAQDSHFERLALIRENCTRLGVECVQVSRAGAIAVPELNVHFDGILVDAPCSNTGVIRRRVDVRWRVRADELARLRRCQIELLGRVALLLKPGGALVYSTCSLEPEENGEVVREFLSGQPRMILEAERELVPFRDGVDGAYAARLRFQA
ncbi:MAG TPA: 16S rRNA (cytosine(967)-C(5))-methyltransferase RsmB [Verrucomicrobiae bacterium]|nr:16S rRNA (cytosine(967)-C(5))-methyltransferase RsmB [Verrucomicrobiae bacterium]